MLGTANAAVDRLHVVNGKVDHVLEDLRIIEFGIFAIELRCHGVAIPRFYKKPENPVHQQVFGCMILAITRSIFVEGVSEVIGVERTVLKLRAAFCLLFTVICVTGPQKAFAQTLYGQLVRNVRDASEAAVVGAAVTVVNVNTNQSRETITDSVGSFSIPTLDAGTYTVKVIKAGFSTAVETDVVVSINTVTRVDVALKVGATSETINVTAESAVLQTDRAEVRTEITSASFQNLPVTVGRNYQQLLRAVSGFQASLQCPLGTLEPGARSCCTECRRGRQRSASSRCRNRNRPGRHKERRWLQAAVGSCRYNKARRQSVSRGFP